MQLRPADRGAENPHGQVMLTNANVQMAGAVGAARSPATLLAWILLVVERQSCFSNCAFFKVLGSVPVSAYLQ